MLALLLGSVLAYPSCDNVTSCFVQVNGSRPLIQLVGTLPLGGVGYALSTTDCMRGLVAIDETCQCQNETMWGAAWAPKYCYSSGNWAQKQSTNMRHFCKNQNGVNTFSLLNSTSYTQCECFDPLTGSSATASISQPVCKDGQKYYKPCSSTDGTGDNADVLTKYTGATLKAVMDLNPWHYNPMSTHFPKCACGTEECRATPEVGFSPAEEERYCQADISSCSRFAICPKGVFTPNSNFAPQECACGYRTCYTGTKCESKVIDGIKEFVCTLNGRSSNIMLLVKQMFGNCSMTFVFGIVAFVFMLCIMVFSILTCCKVKK